MRWLDGTTRQTPGLLMPLSCGCGRCCASSCLCGDGSTVADGRDIRVLLDVLESDFDAQPALQAQRLT